MCDLEKAASDKSVDSIVHPFHLLQAKLALIKDELENEQDSKLDSEKSPQEELKLCPSLNL